MPVLLDLLLAVAFSLVMCALCYGAHLLLMFVLKRLFR